MDRFQELLWDLGALIEVPLHIDKNHACRLLLDETLPIQMELSEERGELLIGAFLGEIPPGRFRENVLKESLKVNGAAHPFGTFAYIDKINTLVLHTFLPAETVSGETLAAFLEGFIAEAKTWQEAISSGQLAPSHHLKTYDKHPSPYNLPPKAL